MNNDQHFPLSKLGIEDDILKLAQKIKAFPKLTSHDMAEEKAWLQQKFHHLLTPELVIDLIERARSK